MNLRKSAQPAPRGFTPYELDKLAEAIIRRMKQRDRILTVAQVAERLGLTEGAVRTRCCRGQIPYHKKHGALYFSENELNDYFLTDNKNNNGSNQPE